MTKRHRQLLHTILGPGRRVAKASSQTPAVALAPVQLPTEENMKSDPRLVLCADPDCGCYHRMDARRLDKSIRATVCPNCACGAYLPTFEYTVICSWCKAVMAIKHTEDEKMNGTVSHSICPPCSNKIAPKGE